jgi:glycosyltransferase involved in cell wall biosynthesis
MKDIRISVITISYNSAKTIERTIKSVISQNYNNLDYIIIDGGSNDGTIEIVNKYKEHISTIVSERDNGISDAFNKGISRATGDVIGIINSDDYLLEGALNKIASEFDGKSDIYCGNILIEDIHTGLKFREIPSTKYSIIPIFCHVAHQGMYVTKQAYSKYGAYNTSIHYPMDLEFAMRAYRLGAKFHYINYDIGVFRTGGVTSDKLSKKKKDYLSIVKLNNGNSLQAYFYYYCLFLIQITKKILNSLMPNLSHRLRYKKTNK